MSFVFEKEYGENAGDYWKQVKASRPLVDAPRRTSDGKTSSKRMAVEEYARQTV